MNFIELSLYGLTLVTATHAYYSIVQKQMHEDILQSKLMGVPTHTHYTLVNLYPLNTVLALSIGVGLRDLYLVSRVTEQNMKIPRF